MYRPVVRLELYKKLSGNDSTGYVYEDTPIVITDFTSLSSNFGIEKRKDSIKFSIDNKNILINNTNSFSMPEIESQDLIKLYAYNYPMTGILSDHLIMIAYIKGYTYDSTEGKARINFTSYNRSEVLLSSFMFAPYNDGEKVPIMIVESINRIKTYNVNNQVKAYMDYTGSSTPGTKGAYDETGTEVSGETGYIRAYKAGAYDSDGNLKSDYTSTVPDEYLFDEVTFAETYKPFIDNLETISAPDYTGDTAAGTYISFVDNDNNLHWEPKSFINTSSVDGSTLILREYNGPSTKINANSEEITNAVIVNAGTDPQEVGILTLAYNASSMGKNGAKWKYLAKTDIAETVRQDEIESGSYQNSEGITITDGQNYPAAIGDDNYPDTFPWTIQTSGEDEFGSWSYIAGIDTVSNRPEYKQYFRRVCEAAGKKAGTNVVTYAGEPTMKGSYELEEGSLIYAAGDMVQLIVPSKGITEESNTLIRIVSVNHTFQNARWTTTLELEEDVDYRASG